MNEQDLNIFVKTWDELVEMNYRPDVAYLTYRKTNSRENGTSGHANKKTTRLCSQPKCLSYDEMHKRVLLGSQTPTTKKKPAGGK